MNINIYIYLKQIYSEKISVVKRMKLFIEYLNIEVEFLFGSFVLAALPLTIFLHFSLLYAQSLVSKGYTAWGGGGGGGGGGRGENDNPERDIEQVTTSLIICICIFFVEEMYSIFLNISSLIDQH